MGDRAGHGHTAPPLVFPRTPALCLLSECVRDPVPWRDLGEPSAVRLPSSLSLPTGLSAPSFLLTLHQTCPPSSVAAGLRGPRVAVPPPQPWVTWCPSSCWVQSVTCGHCELRAPTSRVPPKRGQAVLWSAPHILSALPPSLRRTVTFSQTTNFNTDKFQGNQSHVREMG